MGCLDFGGFVGLGWGANWPTGKDFPDMMQVFSPLNATLAISAPGGGEPVVFTIEGRSGVDVSKISEFPSESEVLFRPNTQFDVVSYVTGFTTMNMDPTQVLATARHAINTRRNAPLTIPLDYCTRFTTPLE